MKSNRNPYIDKNGCPRLSNSVVAFKCQRELKLSPCSLLLHEIVHWGDWKDGIDQVGEEGKMFEKSAYGKDINRYW